MEKISLIKKELRNILQNKIDGNKNYIKKLLEPYINIDINLVQEEMEIKYRKENFIEFLNYVDDNEEEEKKEDKLKKVNKIEEEEEESSLKEKNKILFGTKEENFLKNKKGKTLREIYIDYCSYYSINKVENCANENKKWNKLISLAIYLPELKKRFDEY